MKYGLTRKLDIYNIEKGKGQTIIATAGDYIQSQLWCSNNLKDVPEAVADVYASVAWAYFAMRRMGVDIGYHLPEKIDRAALDDMAASVTVFFEAIKDDELPLAVSKTPQKK